MSEKDSEDGSWFSLFIFVFRGDSLVAFDVSDIGSDFDKNSSFERVRDMVTCRLGKMKIPAQDGGGIFVIRPRVVRILGNDPDSEVIRSLLQEQEKLMIFMRFAFSTLADVSIEYLQSLPALPNGDNAKPDATSNGDEPDDELGEPDPNLGKSKPPIN